MDKQIILRRGEKCNSSPLLHFPLCAEDSIRRSHAGGGRYAGAAGRGHVRSERGAVRGGMHRRSAGGVSHHSVIDIACALLLCGIFYPVMQINYKDAAPDTGATHLPKE